MKTSKPSTTLEERLRKDCPQPSVPAGLHAGIMRAVRGAAVEEREQEAQSTWWNWASAGGMAMVVAGVLWVIGGVPVSGPLTAKAPAAVALEAGQQVSQTVPKVALEPLSQEMELVNQDFHRAMEFVVASLP